jgi:pyridoxamine 5'-phosphate oxidase
MTKNNNISNLRRDYSNKELTETAVDPDPLIQFTHWFNEILELQVSEPNAMILATSSLKGIPSVRTVLLKKFDADGFVFFTNYESHKAKDLIENPNAEILFLWLDLERQVRLRGAVEKATPEESAEYFHSRPLNSQIGAWASKQSRVIPDRKSLELKFAELSDKYKGREVPLPPFWGGFILRPVEFEFWQGRENRLHDRICYRKNDSGWEIVRLSP